jgi:ribosome-binding factor A
MQERYVEALREAAAEFLAREANRNTLITVTRAEMSADGKRAIVYITVFPDTGEEAALKFANRNRGELGKFLSTRTKGMRLPHIDFQIDLGDKHRRRLEELS